VADQRAPRDGAFVDSIGYYDPLTEPSTIHIDRDSALSWLAKGAQPSDVVEKLLRRAGIVEGEGPVYKNSPKKAEEAAPAAAPAAAAPAPAATAVAEEAAPTPEGSTDDGTTTAEQ